MIAQPSEGAVPPSRPPFSSLLVPFDGTPESSVALGTAEALARATGARLTLLRVVHDEDVSDDEAVTAEEYARGIAVGLRADGIGCDVVVRAGTPAATILGEAQERGSDLVVMATHRRSGIGRAVLGSVAEGVLAGGRTPVLLLRPGGHLVSAVRTLLVPIDGSPGGAMALGLALALARATGASLVLVQVVAPLSADVMAGDGGTGAGAWAWDPDWDEEVVRAAQVYVDGMAARLRHAGVAASSRAVLAEAGQGVAAVINATAEAVDADLVVMSTHALTGPVRTLVGSVSDEVIRTGRRGVLLIRRDSPFVDRGHHAAGNVAAS